MTDERGTRAGRGLLLLVLVLLLSYVFHLKALKIIKIIINNNNDYNNIFIYNEDNMHFRRDCHSYIQSSDDYRRWLLSDDFSDLFKN